MSNDVQFQSLAEVDNFAESTNSSLNYLILEASGMMLVSRITFQFLYKCFDWNSALAAVIVQLMCYCLPF